MIVAPNPELDRARCAALDGSLWFQQPGFAAREQRRVKDRPSYRRGLALELLRDFERESRCPPDRSERMIRAAGVLVDTVLATGMGLASITPLQIIQSRTCQFYVRCDLEPTQSQLLANLNPAPNIVIRGNLTQRFTLRVAIDSLGSGALGVTTLKASLDGTTNYTITGIVTSGSFQQLIYNGSDTGIWISCAAGPYSADDAWVSRIVSLADQAGTASGRDFIAQGVNNISQMFDYIPSSSAIRNRAYMSSDATRSTYFSTAYIPADPGVTPSFISWVGNARAHVNTGRIWGTGTVNQFCLRQATPSPNCALAGAVAVLSNAEMVVGTWLGCEAYASDATTDRLKFGSNASLTPAPAGGCQSGVPNSGFTLGARAVTAALPSSYDFAEIGLWSAGEPTATELTRSRAYKTVFYGVAA